MTEHWNLMSEHRKLMSGHWNLMSEHWRLMSESDLPDMSLKKEQKVVLVVEISLRAKRTRFLQLKSISERTGNILVHD